VNMPGRDDIHLLAGAYAVDALDDLEARRFEQHLTACSSCRDDVAGFVTALGSLATAAAELPPPGLRATVIQAVDQNRQTAASVPKRPHIQRHTLAVFAVLSIAACTVFAVLLVGQSHRSSQLSAKALVVEAADAQTSQLVGGAAQVRVTYSSRENSSVLLADGLASAPPGQVYELWFISNGTPQRAATFQTDARRHASIRIGRAPVSGSVLAITVEPTGGSDTPSGTPLFVSSSTT
jgi:anti-sigma-K factor RskA